MRRKRYDNHLSSQLSYTNKVVEQDITRTSSGYIKKNPVYKRYFSQIDANVWFGDKLVTDIQNISYGLQQHDMPLFGYNSYIYDELAIGNRLVQGTFTINFTAPLYIETIIDSYQNMTTNVTDKTTEDDYDKVIAPHYAGNVITTNPEHNAIWRKGFEIDILYGQDDDIIGQPLHVILLDCHIMSVQTIHDSSGHPILEQYTFISRDRKVINK